MKRKRMGTLGTALIFMPFAGKKMFPVVFPVFPV
jgi:hypothetical protein